MSRHGHDYHPGEGPPPGPLPPPPEPAEFAARMRRLITGDNETDHLAADRLMCDLLTALGYGEAVGVFRAKNFWYA